MTVTDGTASCTGTVTAGMCSLTSTTAGAKTITASFVTDTNYLASTSTGVAHTVNVGSSTTAVTSSANPSVFGQSVTFTATVTPTPTVGDIITFNDNGVSIGTGTTNGIWSRDACHILLARSLPIRSLRYSPEIATSLAALPVRFRRSSTRPTPPPRLLQIWAPPPSSASPIPSPLPWPSLRREPAPSPAPTSSPSAMAARLAPPPSPLEAAP